MSCVTIEERTSRKQRRCYWCGENIDPGDRYVHEGGKDVNGDWFKAALHPECFDAVQEVYRTGREEFLDPDYGCIYTLHDHPRGKVGGMCERCEEHGVPERGAVCDGCEAARIGEPARATEVTR